MLDSSHGSNVNMPALSSAYATARAIVTDAGYAHEALWQSSLRFEDVTESGFLRENAWVVLCCGMRESVVRQRFPGVSEAFHNWVSAQHIARRRRTCRNAALQHFNHPPKIDAIVDTADRVTHEGFDAFKESIRFHPLSTFESLSFIGPVTSYHLAKNLGLPVAKPDRHLVRLAAAAGYSDVQLFCGEISAASGDPIPVVDIILWRFATLDPSYLDEFSGWLLL